MQTRPLLVGDIIRHAERAHGTREVVSRTPGGAIHRYDWSGVASRARRGASALAQLGVQPGDRVTSLAWNTHSHLELFFAVPGMGAVLHTANPRFSEDQIVFTINHAESRILLFDAGFAGLVDRIRSRLTTIERFVELETDTPALDGSVPYEALVADASDAFAWPSLDENAAAFLCYTSGTTGEPKGVAYSHRSVTLHALSAGLPGALNLAPFDSVMPCMSLYHATAWGIPFVAAINGCKMVLPRDRFDGGSLDELIRGEGVTFSGGVPTIWTMYLDHLHRTGGTTGSLRRLVIGGSAVPRSMAETFEREHGVTVQQIWGMTEMSPLGVLSTPTPLLAAQGRETAEDVIWTRQGRLQFGVEIRIVDEEGREVDADGASAGTLLVRGPWVVERYYRADRSSVDEDGWFDTGDVATIDRFGFVRLTDRKKDVIKSGGEWISSIDIENAASGLAGVKVAAVVGVAHPKWEERPLLVVEVHDGAVLDPADILAHLAARMPRWWLPEAVVFADVPLTATGKIDKKALRGAYSSHLTLGGKTDGATDAAGGRAG